MSSPRPRLTTVTSPRSAPCQAVNKVQAAWLITLTLTRVSYPAAQELVLMMIGTQAAASGATTTFAAYSFISEPRIQAEDPQRHQEYRQMSPLPIPYGCEIIFPNVSLVHLCNHNGQFRFSLSASAWNLLQFPLPSRKGT